MRGQEGYQRSDISDQETGKGRRRDNAEAQSSQRIAEKRNPRAGKNPRVGENQAHSQE
jgi:hypothetical protein